MRKNWLLLIVILYYTPDVFVMFHSDFGYALTDIFHVLPILWGMEFAAFYFISYLFEHIHISKNGIMFFK